MSDTLEGRTTAASDWAQRLERLSELDAETVAGLRDRTGPDLDRLAALFDRVLEHGDRRSGQDLLDVIRRPAIQRRIPPAQHPQWAARILRVVESTHFTVGQLLRQRVATYTDRPLFEYTSHGRWRTLSWRHAHARAQSLARTLVALDEGADSRPIAILSENRLEMALVDLACLSGGLVNVMVPANATASDVAYILEHSGAGSVVVSGEHQLHKIPQAVGRVITLDRVTAAGRETVPLDLLVEQTRPISAAELARRQDSVGIGDLATIMYTSGTTGAPKGIQFSQRNIVFKRFARALALPEIGDSDVFLCFLPLFHTFGRFLEMMGCVFWGARYCFLENPSVTALINGMQRHRPTVFISVPKKWIQLYERINQQVDEVEDTDARIGQRVSDLTGGRLRWGLSAAGHLDSEIFRFFQRSGVELLSGFGMTEATGGITMTPPGGYRDDSLGCPLPGIETRLADDGELLIRGPYVMMGYLDPPTDEKTTDDDGWFHTGDLMQIDGDGHLRLVDRKKEIYKNVKGETIAPQRVENLFRDFESVARAFLIGDHREYNTLLIHPNAEYMRRELDSLDDSEIQDHFRSLVVSVNKFLAPYESIVDFALIDRDLDPERGELTPKGTPRRKIVEQNFADVVRAMYRRASLRVGDAEVVLPNWLFQMLGITARDIRTGADGIELPQKGNRLPIVAVSPRLTRIGAFVYEHPRGPINLGSVLTSPRLWLGNESLVSFVPLDATTRQRRGRSEERIHWHGRARGYEPDDDARERLGALLEGPDLDLLDLDQVARMLGSEEPGDAMSAVRVLAQLIAAEKGPLIELARWLLGRMATYPATEVRRYAFRVLAPAERRNRFPHVLRRFLDADPDLLRGEDRWEVIEDGLSEPKLDAVLALATEASSAPAGDTAAERMAATLLGFLTDYGSAHPVTFRRLRAFLARTSLLAPSNAVRRRAANAVQSLQRGFREWLGPASTVSVDPETGREYRWEDVVHFDRAVPDGDRQRLLAAMKRTPCIAEGIFLFSTGATVRLSEIAPGGLWVRLLGSRHGKSVYRLTVQTRFQGSFDLAFNLNHDMSHDAVQEEVMWLIVSGAPGHLNSLVEEFGGYWTEQDLWSEEFIAGETLDRAMARLAEERDSGRLTQLWPYFARATMSAYVDFWNRTGGRLEIADPGHANIVVPIEDFLTGPRIVSLSRRRPHRGLLDMMATFRADFDAPAERTYPELDGIVGWDQVFSSVLEVIGETGGLERFRLELDRVGPTRDAMTEALASFVSSIEQGGFVPLRPYFAAERYRRWAQLSDDATPQARALTLRELYETYGLQRLAEQYPETRLRFFLDTVLRDASPELVAGLRRVIAAIRAEQLAPEDVIHAVDELRAELSLQPDEEYFLARLSYPYLRPEDAANYVTHDHAGKRHSELVVAMEDNDGHRFRLRHALNPREVERLLRLFRSARLDVRFRPEHQYLVAINDRSQIIGGIYYEVEEGGESAHLEKIVVSDRLRRKGVAGGLMSELFNRLRVAGVKHVTTGFFRPEYFYGHGFRIERHYAGLVKDLQEPEPEPG